MVSLNADIMHDLCVIICHKLVVPHIIVDLLRKSKYFYTDASVLYGMPLSITLSMDANRFMNFTILLFFASLSYIYHMYM